VDDFIAKLSEAFAFPAARDWPLGTQTDKMLKCNGLDIEASIQNAGSVSLRSTSYVDISRGRAAADEEKIRREFKR